MPFLLVPSHHDVAQDVFGETNGPLELARLVRRQRELKDAVMPITVVRDLVREAPARGRRDLVDLAAEAGDGGLKTLADRVQALFVGCWGDEVHELVGAHLFRHSPFLGFAAGTRPGAKRRRGTRPRRSRELYLSQTRGASRQWHRPRLASEEVSWSCDGTGPRTARPATCRCSRSPARAAR